MSALHAEFVFRHTMNAGAVTRRCYLHEFYIELTQRNFVPTFVLHSYVLKSGNPVIGENQVKSSTALALSTTGGEDTSSSSIAETLQVGSYFALWYLFNIAYNIYNKQALNAVAFPWSIATIQMIAGCFYFVPLWLFGIRKAPKLSLSDVKTLIPIALCHTGVHVGAVIALGAGAVSFAHIVKASEPVVTCVLNGIILKEILPMKVYLTLLPIIGGVAIASMKELSFTYLALGAAMMSNVSSSMRGVLSKKTMSGKKNWRKYGCPKFVCCAYCYIKFDAHSYDVGH